MTSSRRKSASRLKVFTVKMAPNGRLVVPRDVREEWDLLTGGWVALVRHDHGFFIVPAELLKVNL